MWDYLLGLGGNNGTKLNVWMYNYTAWGLPTGGHGGYLWLVKVWNWLSFIFDLALSFSVDSWPSDRAFHVEVSSDVGARHGGVTNWCVLFGGCSQWLPRGPVTGPMALNRYRLFGLWGVSQTLLLEVAGCRFRTPGAGLLRGRLETRNQEPCQNQTKVCFCSVWARRYPRR